MLLRCYQGVTKVSIYLKLLKARLVEAIPKLKEIRPCSTPRSRALLPSGIIEDVTWYIVQLPKDTLLGNFKYGTVAKSCFGW